MSDERIIGFWQEFQQRHGIAAPCPPVTTFGDTPQLRDEFAGLVLAGRKRATAGLALWYGQEREMAPKSGEMEIFTDGADMPRGVIRITEIRVGPLASVDDDFARDEGEGDGSRDYWLAVHREFFARELAAEGLALADTVQVLFQRFALVYPAG